MTERVGEFLIDAGPDALLVQKPAAVALCNELGLGDRLFPTKLPRTAFVLRDGELHSLPGASILGFPTRLRPLFKSTLFGVAAKLRMAAGARSFRGRRAPRRRIDCGIRAAPVRAPRPSPTSPSRCSPASMPATSSGCRCARCFPGSSTPRPERAASCRAFRRDRGPVNADGAFRSFPNGLGELDRRIDASAFRRNRCGCGSNVTTHRRRRRVHDPRRGQAVDTRARGHPGDSGVCGRRAAAAARRRSVGRVRIDSVSVDGDGRLRVSARCGSASI